MKYLLPFFIIICCFFQTRAQSTPTKVSAEISLGQAIKKGKLYQCILLSFTNHSNQKIYIPDIAHMLTIDSLSGVVLVTRNDSEVTHLKDFYLNIHRNENINSAYRSKYGNRIIADYFLPANDTSFPLYTFRKKQDEIYVHNFLLLYRNDTTAYQSSSFYKYVRNCLYLNPHSKKENVFFIRDLAIQYRNIFQIPGHYKLIYSPQLNSSNAGKYPEKLAGYRKYLPNKISSNTLYLDVVNKDQTAHPVQQKNPDKEIHLLEK